jgi:hypothetical protein
VNLLVFVRLFPKISLFLNGKHTLTVSGKIKIFYKSQLKQGTQFFYQKKKNTQQGTQFLFDVINFLY